ncbi:hypothetical protein DPMN_021417 [Dreissena polymorpha]|uniref:Uncharacterized protein n=1 Tax=Dreissena polymorpha TaxID=45954 RepID=A0A9D4NM07_DREPO|nr:hypothetical protein DPMN_021417 [Dreissena polymorpha]
MHDVMTLLTLFPYKPNDLKALSFYFAAILVKKKSTLKEIKDLVIKNVMFCVTVPPRRRRGSAIVIPANVAASLAVPLALPAAPVWLLFWPLLQPELCGLERTSTPGPGATALM